VRESRKRATEDNHQYKEEVETGPVGLPDPAIVQQGYPIQVPAAGFVEDQYGLDSANEQACGNCQPCPVVVRPNGHGHEEQLAAFQQQHDTAGKPNDACGEFHLSVRRVDQRIQDSCRRT